MPLSNRYRLLLRWRIWSDEGADPWVVEVLREGYRIPFRRAPTLSREPLPFSAYCPNSIWGKALGQEVESLLQMGAIELAPLPSLGYYSHLFVVMKASGSWHPVIDLSRLLCSIGVQVGVSYFTARCSARIHGDHFVSFPDSCMSPVSSSHRVLFLGHLQDEWLG